MPEQSAAFDVQERVFGPIFDRLDAEEFAEEAQAAREFFEPRGFRVHVQTNDRRIVMVREAKSYV